MALTTFDRKAYMKEYNKRYYADNREREKERTNAYRLENLDKYRELDKARYPKEAERRKETARKRERPDRYLREFGITVEDYDRLLEQQSGVCAACKSDCITGRRLAIDHDHQTGQVRGLLCYRCNTALGLLKDNKETIMNLLTYLGGDN